MKHAYQIVASFVATLLLCLSLTTPSNAQNEAFEAAGQVPASIHSAMSGGFWTAGKDEGFFRVVVVAGGVEHVAHRLFIQWLRSDSQKQSYELVRTVNVKEFNLGHGFVLEVKTSFGDINSFKIDVTANSRGGKVRRFAITAKGDGKYVIRTSEEGVKLAQSSNINMPVMIKADGDFDTCGLGQVTGLNPAGDNFLAVRSGPGTSHELIGKLHTGDRVWTFDYEGDWIGIAYGPDEIECSPVKKDRPYDGPGKSGWVHKKYVRMIAG